MDVNISNIKNISGTFKNAAGSGACTACAAGKYSTSRARKSGCESCKSGTYQAKAGSTMCKSCSWSWESEIWATVSTSAKSVSGCFCKEGATGSKADHGVSQDAPFHRPVYNSSVGRVGNVGFVFNRSAPHFLHSGPHTWNIKTNGGLTIAAKVKFVGEAGMHERIIDFGNAVERYYDSILLSRWYASSRLYAAITDKV